MTYRTNKDLPTAIRDLLPDEAQDMYRETFNFAYTAAVGDADREKCAHMIAWAQVKRSYAKDGEHFVQRRKSALS